MERKAFTQYGKFTIALLVPVVVFCSVMLALVGIGSTMAVIILSAVIAILLACILIFYKLTIYIDKQHVSFSFGTGLFHRKYPVSDIESCRPVRNPLWHGMGIKYTPDGWLYNVSGLYAVELTFRSRKAKIRIGTDKPVEVSKAINEILGRRHDVTTPGPEGRSGLMVLWLSIILTLTVSAMVIVSGDRETRLTLNDSGFEIHGMYSVAIRYADVLHLDTMPGLPKIKARTNGFATGKTLRGNFRLHDLTMVKLHVKKRVPPFINVKTPSTDLYLNFSNRDTTVYYFKHFAERVNLNRKGQ